MFRIMNTAKEQEIVYLEVQYTSETVLTKIPADSLTLQKPESPNSVQLKKWAIHVRPVFLLCGPSKILYE